MLSPEFPDTFWSFKHALMFVRKQAALPPLGLLAMAAMLPKEWEKRLIDLNVAKLRNVDLAWADLVERLLSEGRLLGQSSGNNVDGTIRASPGSWSGA